jgi:serine/threonine protein kinase
MTERIATTLGRFHQYQIVEAQPALRMSGSDFFKAYHLQEQRPVGVHFVAPSLPLDQHFRTQFVSAMERARRLQDPNLVTVREFELRENECYIVTEWLEGEPLYQLQERLRGRNQTVGLLDAIEIVQQMGCAIEALDLNGSHLREINPRTITLVQQDQGRAALFEAILTDLGLLTLANGAGATLQGRSNLELRYLAPELLNGAAPTLTSSVYALGVLLYELVLDATPFPIETLEDAHKYKTARLLPLRTTDPDFPIAFEAVLFTALEKDPKQRFDRPSSLISALARALATFQAGNWELEHRQVADLPSLLPPRKGPRKARSSEARIQRDVVIEKSLLKATPAGDSTTITIANRTNQVDHFTVTLEPPSDLPASWLSIVPINAGRAEINQVAKFTLQLRPTTDTFVRAKAYPVKVRVGSSLRTWKEEATVTVVVERVNGYHVDAIWPQLILPDKPATLAIKNLGNARETFQIFWRSKSGAIRFEPSSFSAVVDALEQTSLTFYPSPHWVPWFGREKKHPISAQVVAHSSGKVEIREAEVQVQSVLYPMLLILSAVTLLAALLAIVYRAGPSLTDTNAGWCLNLPRVSDQPGLVTCWNTDTAHVKSLALQLNTTEKEIPIIQVRGVFSPTATVTPTTTALMATSSVSARILVPTPDVTLVVSATNPVTAYHTLTYTVDLTRANYFMYVYEAPDLAARLDRPRLVARNWLGEQRWLGPFRWLGTSYYDIPYNHLRPGITPTPVVGQLSQFCVKADGAQAPPVCSNSTVLTPTFELSAGEAAQLLFTWEPVNLAASQPVLIPTPAQIDAASRSASAPVPAQAGDYTYTLNMLDTTGKILATRSLGIKIKEIGCFVDANRMDTEMGQALYKSPGEIYELIGTLPEKTEVIVKSAPADYTQNLDCRQWVRVVVKATQEEGWLDFDGLSCSASQVTARQITDDPGKCAVVAATRSAETITQTAGAAPGQTPGQPASSAVAQLPVEKPVFGPTATATPTPTVPPPPTPTPTLEPAQIDISLDKEVINVGECVHIKWRIVGVFKVFFDDGSGEVSSNDNIDRTEEYCNLKRTTTFRWRIVTDQDSDHDDTTNDEERDADDFSVFRERTITVQARPDE